MIRKIDERACIGCGVCEMICPGDVIVMDETKKARIICKEINPNPYSTQA